MRCSTTFYFSLALRCTALLLSILVLHVAYRHRSSTVVDILSRLAFYVFCFVACTVYSVTNIGQGWLISLKRPNTYDQYTGLTIII
jgi:hypothetical protein